MFYLGAPLRSPSLRSGSAYYGLAIARCCAPGAAAPALRMPSAKRPYSDLAFLVLSPCFMGVFKVYPENMYGLSAVLPAIVIAVKLCKHIHEVVLQVVF